MGYVLGSASQLRALLTELETATPRPRHLLPNRCVLGSAARTAAEAPAITATGSELGGGEDLPVLKPHPEPGVQLHSSS